MGYSFRSFLIAAPLLFGSVDLALAQDTGICGQPLALTHGQYVLSGPEAAPIDGVVQITRGEPAYIELTVETETVTLSETFANVGDPLLIMFDETGSVLHSNDDGAGNLNARLGANLAPGAYCVQIATIFEAPSGSGSLPDGFETTVPFRINSGNKGELGRCANRTGILELAAPVVPGQAEQGISGHLPAQDVVRVTLAEPTTLALFARSGEFDTYLALEDAYGAQIGGDDDSGGGTDSYVGFSTELPAGDYCAVISSYDGTQGAYSLSVSEWSEQIENTATDGGGAIINPCGNPEQTTVLGSGLAAGFAGFKPTVNVESTAQFFRFELTEPLDLRLTARSASLDTVLGLYDQDGAEIAANDDGDNMGTDSRIDVTALAPGSYCVAVSPYGNDGSGVIGFEMIELSEAALLQEAYASGDILPMAESADFTDLGKLERSLRHDQVSGGGTDWFLFEVADESLVVVDVSGLGNLTKLVLFDYEGSGLKIAETLAEPETISTRLVRSLNSGRYAVGVVRQGGGMGASLLSLQRYVRPPKN